MSTDPMEPVNVVCMLMGDRYSPAYVGRLKSMLDRHMGVPYRLHCIVDRPHRFPAGVETIDASGWTHMRRDKMRITTNKIRLFDPEAIPFEEFLYLDVTLVIQNPMRPLLEHASSRPEDLVIVRDWNYECFNSCVMRIRKSGELQKIYAAFVEGKRYPYRNAGDQDFIYAAVKDLGLESNVSYFDSDHVVSYRNLRDLHRTDPQAAYRAISSGIIVKFFGRPKMHQVVDPLYRIWKIALKNPTYGYKDARFWLKELKANWR